MNIVHYEHAVIGSLLCDPSLIDDINLIVDDFSIETYRIIYHAILDAMARNHVVDVITISSKLSKTKPGENWLLLVGEAAKDCILPSNISAYAKLLKAESRKPKAETEK